MKILKSFNDNSFISLNEFDQFMKEVIEFDRE
jgi:hypothetical protein